MLSEAPAFSYDSAFSRTIGWITRAELAQLRTKRVAIAGLGGVGGSHLLTLARLGIGAFTIADPDLFEIENFNRQAGAFLSTVGRYKADVLSEMALDINPTLDLRVRRGAIHADNVSELLDDADLYVDALDFFAVDARRAVFAACAERGIPAITAAPLGMGAALLIFMPGRMTFEQYFRLEGHSRQQQLLRFLVGLAPARLQQSYLVDPNTIDLRAQRGPSTPMGCEMCASVAASNALKILLRRGPVTAAPYGLQFDAYRDRVVRTWRPGGNRHPIQRLALAVAGRRMHDKGTASPAQARNADGDRVRRVLELARWAPSGDNGQPWRFEIRGRDEFVIHRERRDAADIYDLQGHASDLALGALVETAAIAATTVGAQAVIRLESPSSIAVRLVDDSASPADPLTACIVERVVNRRRLQTTPLTPVERAELESALGDGMSVIWLEGLRARARATRLWFATTRLRLELPEAFETHRRAIDWSVSTSPDRIPEEALGLDVVTRRMMRWAMQSWGRMRIAHALGARSLLARVEMDILPGLFCGAHFVLVAERHPKTADERIAAGRALQRFWLTATRLGLFMQPQYAPIAFRDYVRDGVAFSSAPHAADRAQALTRRLADLMAPIDAERAVFFGRIGHGTAPRSRSLRRSLDSLIEPSRVASSAEMATELVAAGQC